MTLTRAFAVCLMLFFASWSMISCESEPAKANCAACESDSDCESGNCCLSGSGNLKCFPYSCHNDDQYCYD